MMSFRKFFWTPGKLSAALHAMSPAPSFIPSPAESYWDNSDWLEELQGVAWDGANWFFSSGGSMEISDDVPTIIGSSPVAIYTFKGSNTKRNDNDWDHKYVVAEVVPMSASVSRKPKVPVQGPREPSWIYHLGAIASFEEKIYADHFIRNEAHILVLRNNDGRLSFDQWIQLEIPHGVNRVGLVTINHLDRTFLTCDGGENVWRIFAHDFNGNLIRREGTGEPKQLILSPPIQDGCYVQGGGMSNRGHLYVPSGRRGIKAKYQYIYIYSVLTGQRLGEVAVLAEEEHQELEGICLASVMQGTTVSQLHAVLLENSTAKDNVFIKSFTANLPEFL